MLALKLLLLVIVAASVVAALLVVRHRRRLEGVQSGRLLELTAGGRTYYVPVEQACHQFAIASGDEKVVNSTDLVPEGHAGNLPLMVIRPNQTLVVKAVGGKLNCPGSVGGGRLLKGEAADDGSEARYTAHWMGNGHQGNGNSWITLTDADGNHTKLTFGYLITKA